MIFTFFVMKLPPFIKPYIAVKKAVLMPDILSRKTFHHEEKLFSVYKLALTGSNLIISSVSHGSC